MASLEKHVGWHVPAKRWDMLRDTSLDERFAAWIVPRRSTNVSPRLMIVGRPSTGASVKKRRSDVRPKPTVSKAHVSVGETRRDVPSLDDDGCTAIYDITARTVYLPSGRRLQAHSSFGDLMDTPRHVNVRMRGSTPPNVYISRCASDCFMGFARSASIPLMKAGCMVAPEFLLTPTCWARTASRTDACPSAIIPGLSTPSSTAKSLASSWLSILGVRLVGSQQDSCRSQ